MGGPQSQFPVEFMAQIPVRVKYCFYNFYYLSNPNSQPFLGDNPSSQLTGIQTLSCMYTKTLHRA